MRGDTLEGILDDAAARGNAAHLLALSERWKVRAGKAKRRQGSLGLYVMQDLWTRAAWAAERRSNAIALRMEGRVEKALWWETSSAMCVAKFKAIPENAAQIEARMS